MLDKHDIAVLSHHALFGSGHPAAPGRQCPDLPHAPERGRKTGSAGDYRADCRSCHATDHGAVSQDGVNGHHVAVVDEDMGGRGDRVDLGQPLAIGNRNAVRPVGQPRHDRVDGDHGRDPCRCGQPCFTLALHLVLNQTAENYAQCQGQHEAQDAERDGEGNEAPFGS